MGHQRSHTHARQAAQKFEAAGTNSLFIFASMSLWLRSFMNCRQQPNLEVRMGVLKHCYTLHQHMVTQAVAILSQHVQLITYRQTFATISPHGPRQGM